VALRDAFRRNVEFTHFNSPNVPVELETEGAVRIEIDPSSPVLLVRVYQTKTPATGGMPDWYMLHVGDELELEPGVRRIYMVPHVLIPTYPAHPLSLEGQSPLILLRPRVRDRRDPPPRPAYCRFREITATGTVGPDGYDFNAIRLSVPGWDIVRIWGKCKFTGKTTGFLEVIGENRLDTVAWEGTTSIAPLAPLTNSSNFWIPLGNLADSNQNMPWARIHVVLVGAGTYNITLAVELHRMITG
jgi:hypothetical protein